MPLTSFCGVLTLQVGAAILAVSFLLIAFFVFAVNILDYHHDPHNSWPVPLFLIMVFCVLMLIGSVLMFLSAYDESKALCIASVVLVVTVATYWTVLSCFSFANTIKDHRIVCMNDRGPETFWLASLRYRKDPPEEDTIKVKPLTSMKPRARNLDGSEIVDFEHPYSGDVKDYPLEVLEKLEREKKKKDHEVTTARRPREVFAPYPRQDVAFLHSPFFKIADVYDDDDDDDPALSVWDIPSRYEFGLPMVGAIVLFVLNFLFFLFSIMIMWSYEQEIKWAEYFDDLGFMEGRSYSS